MKSYTSKGKERVVCADESPDLDSPDNHKSGVDSFNPYDNRLIRLANLLPEAVYLTDAEGIITYVNQAGLSMFGYSSDMIVEKMSPEMFFVSRDYSRLQRNLRKCLNGTHGLAQKYTALKQNGKTFPVLVYLHPLLKNATCNGSVGLIIDTSSRKSKRDAFLTADQKIHAVLDNAPYGWILCDFQGKFIESSVSNMKGLNISDEDLVGLNICDFVDEDVRESVLRFLQKVKQEGKASGIQHIKLMNGEERSYEYKDVVVYDGEKPVAVRIFAWDITDRVRDKQALEASEARYRGVFENTGLPTVILEENLLISMVNVKFEELSGYAKNEIEEKMSLSQFIGEEAKERILRLFLDKSGDCPSEYECCIINRRGETFDMIVRFGSISSTRQMIASFTDITSLKQTETELKESREHLQQEVSLLRSSLKGCFRFGDIIGKSRVMQDVYEAIVKAAEAKANVIIYGETGTGKELVARAIHKMSSREENRFVTVNCGAIPENIIESEFFGYKKGAFTGAHADKPGYLDFADHGTLFLDEVGELSLNMQVKLLRVIDGGGFIPLGCNEIRKADVRIIAATNRNLKKLIKGRSIREDFFYRVHIIPVYLPPLRDRKEDIPLLIDHFIKTHGGPCPPITGRMMDEFLAYDWPGNVRELQNVIHRYISMRKIDFSGSPKASHSSGKVKALSLEAGNILNMMESYEKEIIEDALNRFRWNRTQAAAFLGINRKTLFIKIAKYGLNQPRYGVSKPHKK
ncbi:MAG TPA: sigma-54-dependent Fis family transcriptional regulator [Deltaproteobacteria bacterium]|nr:sigma-54-dependent Fis family transcriptional regulator [Deltaproteobacteria bacterium]